MDIPQILARRFSNTIWTITGNEYENLIWLSDSAKPSKKTLEGLWDEVQAEIAAEAQAKVDARASAVAKLQALGLTVDEVSAAFGLEA